MAVPVILVPDGPMLVDERIEVKLENLMPFQNVTLRAEVSSQSGSTPVLFESYGHFISDIHGRVNLTKDASFGGTFKGVDGMGLFWSMMQAPGQRKGSRFVPWNITRPMAFKLALHDGHVMSERDASSVEEALMRLPNPIAEATVLRTYLSENVERYEISAGRLRGTLFLPKSQGRLPGVIDMFGSHGGLLEHRAAILASHGFVVFALAFFAYKDLPETEWGLELEYFIEAVEWLAKHPRVCKHGIGYIGSSFGGQVALQVAGKCPIIKAVVAVSSPHIVFCPLKYKGILFGFQKGLTAEDIVFADGNTIVLRDLVQHERDEYRRFEIPVEKVQGKVLLICGHEDMNLNAVKNANKMNERLSVKGLPPMKCLKYPGAGHLIEVPYMPMCKKSYHRAFESLFLWGGNEIEHSLAQEHSWKAICNFLNENLSKVDAKL